MEKSNTEETREGDRLIAEFMGYEYDNHVLSKKFGEGVDSHFKNIHESQLKYHSSWDWLMPVVIKIRSMLQDNDLHAKYKYDWETIELSLMVCDIKALYVTIVHFIKIFNQHGK